MYSTNPSHPATYREPLAVIGIGCRFPGDINSPAAFWEGLLNGVNAIRPVPEDRWDHSRFHDTNREKVGTIRNAQGGFIDGVDMFDAEFFGYFPTEAQRLDPQQRFLLEVTQEAIDDAGLRREQLDGSRTSVFIGSFMYDYLCMQTASGQRDEINPYVAMGTSNTSLANRLSYNFNLKGPSVSLDTACSSSLVAVHLACRSIWGGEADMALAGGVNVMLRPESSIMLSKAGFLNPDQYCKAFDLDANGYVRSEGAGVVVLKPLSKATEDGDAIYAVVQGTAVNQDGYQMEGFTVPNVFSQIAMLRAAYNEAGIDPLTVDFIEAHGPGTPVGDPLETLAIGTVLGRGRPTANRLWLGSVKTNLGHLEGASGIAGFVKAVLTAHHGIVPPNLHFNEPNPGIDFAGMNLQVPTNPTPLELTERPLTVGVNSFGAGGTNAHVILQQPPHAPPSGSVFSMPGTIPSAEPLVLYMLSAGHKDSLRTLALEHAEFLMNTDERLEDVAWSAFARRSRLSQIVAVVGNSRRDIVDRLRKFADGGTESETLAATIPPPIPSNMKKWAKAKVAFVFSGQGGQWIGMGRELMKREPVFRQAVDDVDAHFQELAGWSLLDELAKDDGESRIDETTVVQPAIMAMQIGLLKLYEHYGIRPQGVVGHSIGEVAAAFAAGALNLRQAVNVIYHRSQAQARAAGKGGMLAVGMTQPDAEKAIARYGERVSIGAVNGPEMLTLSGDVEPLREIAESLESRGIFNREVRVEVPYHSYHMEPLRDEMLATLGSVTGRVATTPLFSTVTGKRAPGTHLSGEYWYLNVRQPVLFATALSSMLDQGFDAFVEIGPHPVLVGGAATLFEQRKASAIIGPSMTRRDPEAVVFLQSLARLAARGVDPNTAMVFGPDRKYVRLPKYPWQRTRHWFESPSQTEMRRGPFQHPFLKHAAQFATEEGLAVWDATLDVQKFPYLRDHCVDGEIVFPATGHAELAWAVASEEFSQGSFFLENLRFDSALILPENAHHPLDVRVEIVSNRGDYRICTRQATASSDTPWSQHSSGRFNTTYDRFESLSVDLGELQEKFESADEVDVANFYDTIRDAGLTYGPKFQCIQRLRQAGHEMLADVTLSQDLVAESQRTAVHPAILDACLHVVFSDVHRYGAPDRVYLPHHLERVRFHSQPSQEMVAYVRVTRNDEQFLCSDTVVFDEDGRVVAELLGLTCKRLAGAASQLEDATYNGCYEYQRAEAPREADLHGRIADFTRVVFLAGRDSERLVSELAVRLDDAGLQPTIADPQDSATVDLLNDIPLDRRTLIVYVAAVDGGSNPGWRGLANTPAVPALLELAQAIHRRDGVPRLCVVTNGAQLVGPGDSAVDRPGIDLGQASLIGMTRVVRNECPNVPIVAIDVSQAMSVEELDSLADELLSCRRDRDESEIALRGSRRFVSQLKRVDRTVAQKAASSVEPGVGGDYRADLAEPGILDQITFRRLPPRQLGCDDVEISVQAAALNFKDIVNAMGILPERAVSGGLASDRLGLEVAGRVVRTGESVEHVRVGDDVVARVAEGFSGRVITPSHCVTHKPAHLTPSQAAAIPVVYITAWYALCHLARLSSDETVLIHSAAGGVGGAAINLARHTGATVIATAGTQEKRAALRAQGIEHVFDSRSLDFYNHVMEATGGRGVDVVLNSLTGRCISQSLKCLAPFGRFIEIGKADIYRNSRLNLEELGENIAFFVVDVDRLAAQKPELHRRVLHEVVAMFERHELAPHEINEFPISKLREAMKFMTRAAYRGKIVLNMEGDSVVALPPRRAEFRPDMTCLITGGASGFGLQIAQWMVEHGARHLVLASRSGPKSEADRETIEDLMERGIQVLTAQVDVTDAAAVARLIGRVQSEMPPLAGIAHAAALLDDASLGTMDMDRFGRVFNAKAQGAWNLHEASLAHELNLDFFVMLSSVSSVLGLIGQVNYATANHFLDALAEHRQACGHAGTAVNLGVLGSYAGMSQSSEDENDVLGLLESHGLSCMALADVLDKLEATIVQSPTTRMTADIDWKRFAQAYPHLARDSRFLEIISDAATSSVDHGGSGLRQLLVQLEPSQQHDVLTHELAGALAVILDIDLDQLDVALSLDQFGLDSLMLSQFRNWILRSLDINLPMIKLLKGPSLESLSLEVASQLVSNTDGGAASSTGDAAQADSFMTELAGVEFLNPWLVRGVSDAEAGARLFCFHSMGVGASLFTRFLLEPPAGCDIIAVQTPGRENRMTEPVATSVCDLADEIASHLQPLLDRPFIVWGHSFGGIVANEVLRRLRDSYGADPAHFVVTGTVPPHLIQVWQKREVLLKAMVEDNSPEYLISLSRYVDDPEFIKSILPLMRRDHPLLKNYQFDADTSPLGCPITAFAACQDDFVYTDEIREWSQHTTGGFRLIEVDGDHWFLNRNRDLILHTLSKLSQGPHGVPV